MAPRRSLIFIVSDFISAPGWAEPLAHLAQRHDVVAVRLYDPLEMELPDLGMLVVQDAETGEQIFVDTHDRGFRRRFEAAAKAREAELRSAFCHRGRRRARIVDQRRSRRRDPALRRAAQAPEPARDRRRLPAASRGARMTWLWPEMLWLLLLVPAVVAAYLILLRRKKKAALRYASLSRDEGRARRGPAVAPARPAAHVPRRLHADDHRHRAPGGGRHAAVAARDGDPRRWTSPAACAPPT